MLNKQVFQEKMNQLLIVFPNWNIDLSNKEVAKMWYAYFSDLESKQFIKMVNDYINNEKFNPTIGGLNQYVSRIPGKSNDQIEHEKMLEEEGYFN